MIFTKDEKIYLNENYQNTSNKELSNKLNKSTNQIIYYAKKNKLLKSKDYISEMMSTRNKTMGRDLTYDKLKKIASNYKTRSQFQLSDSSAYVTSRTMGILDDICSHMISQSYSIPQLILRNILEKIFDTKCLYNTRKIIPPYELDIYFEKLNIAFEYNGKGWHINNNNDKIKVDLCHKLDIPLFYIIENNRKYESDIKSQLIKLLPNINSILGYNISEKDIYNIIIDDSIYNDFLDDEYIMNIVNEYTTYTEFRTNETGLYNKLIKMGIIHKYTHNLKKNREMNWCVDKIKKEVSKYKYLSDFVDRSKGCYIFIKRNKEYEYLLNDLIYKKKAKWTIDDIWDEVHNHNNFNSLLNNISLSTLKNRNLVKEIRQYYSDMV